MNWEWLFPVIIFLIWIVNTLVRSTQEDRQIKRPPRPGPENLRTQGRSQTEIERFLEEVNRRRRLAAERRQPDEASAQVTTKPVLRRPEAAAPRPTVPRPANFRPAPRPSVERLKKAEAIVVAEVVPAQPARANLSIPEVSAVLAAENKPILKSPPAGEVSKIGLLRGLAFLNSPQNLRAAWIAREILGPPRCRRNGV
jgi:hypothetical protein